MSHHQSDSLEARSNLFVSPPGSQRPRGKCFETTKSGIHCGKIAGVAITWSLVGFSVITYVYNFLIPSMAKGEALGIVAFFLFVPNVILLFISLWRTMFTHPGRVSDAFDIDFVNGRVQERRRRISEQLEQEAAAAAEANGHNENATSVTFTPAQGGSVAQMPPARSAAATYVPPVMTPNMCSRCYVYKVNRIHHCSTCGECILRMDHHCPWIGQCVGRDNHKFFILFLFYTCTTGVVIGATGWSGLSMLGLGGKDVNMDNFGAGMTMFFAWMISLIFAIVLLPFMIATLSNATDGTTTLEKKIKARERARKRQRREERRRYRNTQQDSDGDATGGDPTVMMSSGGGGGSEALHSVVHISNRLSNQQQMSNGGMNMNDTTSDDEDAEDDDDNCCSLRSWSSLSEIFGDSDEAKRGSRIWWFLPTTPSFKLDVVNIDLFFPAVDTH